MNLERTGAAFTTTRWSLIQRLHEPASRDIALAELAEIYWPAVYAFLRRSGQSRDAAAETAQAFFLESVVGRSLLASADADKGRLRSLVLGALKNFMIDQQRRGHARGAGRTFELGGVDDEERALAADTSAPTPESAFERRWAAAAVSQALERTRLYCAEHRLERHWRVFESHVLAPAVGGCARPALAQIAQSTGFDSAADAAAAAQVVRKRFDTFLREVAAESVRGEDAEDEYRRLREALA